MSAVRPLLVFDFDGTLADTWRDLAAALNRTLADEGLPPVEGPQVKFWVGHGVRPLLARAVPDADPARVEALYARFAVHYERGCLDTTRLYDGIEACLAACAGADLAVASNKPAAFLLPMVERLGIRSHFAAVFGGDSLAARKPDPAVLHEVAARVGHPAFRRSEPKASGQARRRRRPPVCRSERSERGAEAPKAPSPFRRSERSERAAEAPKAPSIWMIGDSAVDIETGRAAGARTIGCAWGLRGREELIAAGCDHLIEHPSEIVALLRSRA